MWHMGSGSADFSSCGTCGLQSWAPGLWSTGSVVVVHRPSCSTARGTFLVLFSCSVVSDSMRPHEVQHARPPCPSPTPRVHLNPCPLSQWCHPAISSSVVPFSSCSQSLPASGSFPVSQLFASGGQSTGISASASVVPVNTQNSSALGWTGWISLDQGSNLCLLILYLWATRDTQDFMSSLLMSLFYGLAYHLSWYVFPVHLRKNVIRCCWVRCSINVG